VSKRNEGRVNRRRGPTDRVGTRTLRNWVPSVNRVSTCVGLNFGRTSPLPHFLCRRRYSSPKLNACLDLDLPWRDGRAGIKKVEAVYRACCSVVTFVFSGALTSIGACSSRHFRIKVLKRERLCSGNRLKLKVEEEVSMLVESSFRRSGCSVQRRRVR
jgi:hypothetical protein